MGNDIVCSTSSTAVCRTCVSKHTADLSLGEQIVEEIRERVQQLSNPPLHATDDLQSCLYANAASARIALVS